MTNSTIKNPIVVNPNNRDCQLCAKFNSLFQSDMFQNKIALPEAYGKGYFQKNIIMPSLEIFLYKITFPTDMALRQEKSNSIPYYFSYCLQGNLQWSLNETRKEFKVNSGEHTILSKTSADSVSRFYQGQNIFCISIGIGDELLSKLLQDDNKKLILDSLSGKGNTLYKQETSFAVNRIIYDILNCNFSGNLKKLYLEAKIIEFIAVYMVEITDKHSLFERSADLSRNDIASLYEAKKILDADISNTPTLSSLSKYVCLNEFKLKKGFKKLFGMPVHTYIIDKRLEKAQFLLESGKVNVSEAACQVGYNGLGQFAAKFRKKYGVNPSEYLRYHKGRII